MPRRFNRITSSIFAMLAVAVSGWAQRPVPRAEAVTPAPSGTNGGPTTGTGAYSAVDRAGMSATPVDSNKNLSVGDTVSIEIVEDLEGAFQRVVTATGDIEVPPLGRVRVAGRTTNDAAADIKRRLDADYYYSATVRIAIDRVNPVASLRKVQVSGEVRAPGTIEWPSSDQMRLTEAIQRAGGPGEWGDKEHVAVFRLKNGATQKSVYNFKAITNEGKIADDPVLEDGDRVLVPKKWLRLTD